jgi:APA family basic amino acid/polyamine antiporter
MKGPPLIRAIGRWTLTAAIINGVVGSGIFGLPSALVRLAGAWSPLTVLMAGGGIFVIVLCFAEVGSRFDQAGGPYLYTRTAFGPAVGFQVGWIHVFTRIVSAAAVLNILVAYLATLLPWVGTQTGRAATIAVAATVVTVINVIGVKQAAWTVNVFTIAKLLPLVAVIVLGLFRFDQATVATQRVAEPKLIEAVLLLVFAYGGFESGIVAGAETREPKRDTSFALLVSMPIVAVVYCLVQLVVVGVLPNAAASTAPFADTLKVLVGPVGSALASVAVTISVFGWLMGFALMSPRILFAMAEKNEIPSVLARIHPRFRTPYLSILFNSVIALGLALVGSFTQLATVSAISRLLIYAACCAALIALRKRSGESEHFRVPYGRVVAVLGILLCLWLLGTRSFAQAWFLIAVVGSGGLAWLASASARRKAA